VGAGNWQGIMENVLLLCGPTLNGRVFGASSAGDEILERRSHNEQFVICTLYEITLH
jgi:hypothetical protein